MMESKMNKKDIGYQTIGGSKTSLATSNSPTDRTKELSNDVVFNAPVNLKKSKTFKLIVKKSKDKDKISFLKKEKSKDKNRKRKDVNIETGNLDSNKEDQIVRPVFGVSIKDACKHSKSYDGYPVPAFFRMLLDHLEKENRLSSEGIYRIPGVNSQVIKLKHLLNRDCDIPSLLQNFDIDVISSTVKSFIRDLPSVIIDKRVEKLMFIALDENKNCINDRIEAFKRIIHDELPEENKYLLSLIIGHMAKVIDMSHLNKMTLENVLIVLSPALRLHFELLKFMNDHSSRLFSGLQVPVYVPPIRPSPDHEEQLPETVDGINDELKKQISYLDDLHAQISEGIQSQKIEYLIWEVQLIVTRLKRKKYIVELEDPEQIRIEIKKYERQLQRLRKDMLDKNPDANTPITINANVTANSSAEPVSNAANHELNTNSDSGCLLPSSSVDREFWQVQRTLTTLNRKLKALIPSTRVTSTISLSNSQQSKHNPHQIKETGDTATTAAATTHNHNDSINTDNLNNIHSHPTHQLDEVDNKEPEEAHHNQAAVVHGDDSDDDSIQMNLTLRKLPLETVDSFDESKKSSKEDLNVVNQIEVEQSHLEAEISPAASPKEEKSRVDLDTVGQTESTGDAGDKCDEKCDGNEADKGGTVTDHDSIGSSGVQDANGSIKTSRTDDGNFEEDNDHDDDDDEINSNSESLRTGSNMAACIDDLIQTGELWTNESEQLLPEDEDMRNEVLRLLYTKDELVSIRNDLKTRLSSESNEILRLKRHIEELEEEKSHKLFHQQNQYQTLQENETHQDSPALVNTTVHNSSSEYTDSSSDDDDDDNHEHGDSDNDENHNNSQDDNEDRNPLFNHQDDDEDNNNEEQENDEVLKELNMHQKDILLDNSRLEKENEILLDQIQVERERCLELKVALRSQMMMQMSTVAASSNNLASQNLSANTNSNNNSNNPGASTLFPSQCWP